MEERRVATAKAVLGLLLNLKLQVSATLSLMAGRERQL